VEKLASFVPPSWLNLTRYYGVFASAYVWCDFIVPGVKKKKSLCPAYDEPGDGAPPSTGKPSAGRAAPEYWLPWSELLRRTVSAP
jgi:hypothetical protein